MENSKSVGQTTAWASAKKEKMHEAQATLARAESFYDMSVIDYNFYLMVELLAKAEAMGHKNCKFAEPILERSRKIFHAVSGVHNQKEYKQVQNNRRILEAEWLILQNLLKEADKPTPKKVVRDGKVAVIVCPEGSGGGWYDEHWIDALFDPFIVDIIENNKSTIPMYDHCRDVHGFDPKRFANGRYPLEVVWVDIGTKFQIRENDAMGEYIQAVGDSEDGIVA